MSLDPTNTAVIPVIGKKLSNRETWPDWYTQLRYQAHFCGIWKYVDPNAQDAPQLASTLPAEGSREGPPAESSGVAAASTATAGVTQPAVTQGDRRELGAREWIELTSRYISVWDWINATVDAELLSSCLWELDLIQPDGYPSIQRIVRLLKERIALT